MNTNPKNYDQCPIGQDGMQPLTQFYIYEDLNLICNRVFNKDQITIGSSQDADLCLEHHSVEQIHALVHYRDNQVFLTNKYPQNGLRLNGRSVGLAELQHEDVIDIGPFSLKIKMTAAESQEQIEQDTNYAVRLVNRYSSPQSLQTAAKHLAIMLKADTERVLPLLEKDHYILKRGLSGFKAAQIQNALLKAGVVCDVQMDSPQPSPEPAPGPKVKQTFTPITASSTPREAVEVSPPAVESVTVPVAPAPAPEPMAEPPKPSIVPPAAPTPESIAPGSFDAGAIAEDAKGDQIEYPPAIEVSFTELFEDEIDEDEDEIWEANFSLKTDLGSAPLKEKNTHLLPEQEQLQVVKTIGQSVVDVRYLAGRQKYTIDTEEGPLRLVDAKPKGDSYLNILPTFQGYVQTPSGETTADLDSYKSPDFLKIKKKTVYRIPVPQENITVVEAGGCSYRIAKVMRQPSPQVAVAHRASDFSWRHWATSAGVHLFLLLCISVWVYFQAAPPKAADPHFVKIDPSMLEKLEPPKPKVPPKPKEPPPKPEPVKVAEKVKKPPKKKPPKKKKPPVRMAKKSKVKKKVARTGPVSRHPKAGGGFGEGNIKNRNINQTGLLSVLGKSSIGGPSQAIAAVTNLDAVSVPGATEKNFSVGGLKGSLGNGKIAVATGGAIMQTKGSKQVLRSAGARGKGHVAALERGTTGKKKVQAMVTAKLSRTVKIEGGMSREMVKRVIDQHLEEITFCYETALMSNPNILGRMVFEWKIMMNGRVGEIRIVASSVNSHEIHNCIKTAIKSWQFPKPVGAEVVVSYPFVFDLVSF